MPTVFHRQRHAAKKRSAEGGETVYGVCVWSACVMAVVLMTAKMISWIERRETPRARTVDALLDFIVYRMSK